MTAATPEPEHGSPGTPDGRASSGPADAVTPGQAAYEAYWRCAADEFGPDHDDAAPSIERWDTLPKWQQRAWGAAAQQPHAADGNAPELRITDCSAHGDALHIQVNTGRNWLCAVALAAILAEYEPQPEPQPAPVLAADIASLTEQRNRVSDTADQLREQLAGVLDWFHGTGSGYTARVSGVRLTREYTRARLPVPERLSHPEGQ